MPPDSLTVIRARRRRLAKLIHADGTIEGYDDAKHFDLFTVLVQDLAALHRLLGHLLHRPDCAVVRGEIAIPEQVRRVRRLLHPDLETSEPATIRETPRAWLAIDLDGVERPACLLAGNLAACAAEAIGQLPDGFRGTFCIAQASASHGIKPGIRLRLWYWLSRPATGQELKSWFRGAAADPSIFGAAQVIYTAAPIFDRGIRDHLPQRIIELSGEPFVAVPPSEQLKPPPRPTTSVRPVPNQGSARADLYVRAALTHAANRIIGSGRRHPVILSEACGLARLVNAGLLGRSEMKAVLWQAAQQAGKDDEAEIDRLVDFGMDHANTTPLPNGITHG